MAGKARLVLDGRHASMRNVIGVLAAVFLGLLIAVAVRPLLIPPIPLPDPGATLRTPPTIPPPAQRATPLATPARLRATPPLAAPRRSPVRPPSPPLPRPTPRPVVRPAPAAPRSAPAPAAVLWIVQVEVLPSREAAGRVANALRAAGFAPYVVPSGSGYAVRLGAFRERARALRVADQARAKGFPAAIIQR